MLRHDALTHGRRSVRACAKLHSSSSATKRLRERRCGPSLVLRSCFRWLTGARRDWDIGVHIIHTKLLQTGSLILCIMHGAFNASGQSKQTPHGCNRAVART